MKFKLLAAAFFLLLSMLMASFADARDLYKDIAQNAELSNLAEICPYELVQNRDIDFHNRTSDCKKNEGRCLKLCLDGSSDHCFGLANHLNITDDKSEPYSRPLYAKSCQLGLASACTNVAAGMKNTDGLDAATCYAKTFKKTCELKDPWGCTMYAVRLIYGEGVQKDLDEALTVMRGSCRFGESDRACSTAMELASEIVRGDFDGK